MQQPMQIKPQYSLSTMKGREASLGGSVSSVNFLTTGYSSHHHLMMVSIARNTENKVKI